MMTQSQEWEQQRLAELERLKAGYIDHLAQIVLLTQTLPPPSQPEELLGEFNKRPDLWMGLLFEITSLSGIRTLIEIRQHDDDVLGSLPKHPVPGWQAFLESEDDLPMPDSPLPDE